MAGIADNWTHADVGWYYMYDKVARPGPDRIRVRKDHRPGRLDLHRNLAGGHGKTSPQHRQMLEMAGRYKQCRLANFFPESVRAQLREPGRGFKFFGDGPSWRLMPTVYEEPRLVESLDGEQNAWTIRNDQAFPCPLGVGIARGFRNMRTAVKAGLGGLRRPAPAATVTAAGAADGDRQRTPGRAARSIAVRSGGVDQRGARPSALLARGHAARTDARRRHRGMMLAPGENRITFTADTREGYPDDVNVLLYRLHPLPLEPTSKLRPFAGHGRRRTSGRVGIDQHRDVFAEIVDVGTEGEDGRHRFPYPK